MKLKRLFLSLALVLGTLPAGAAVRTVTLSVPGMSCPTCPITVKVALRKVPGVLDVRSSLEKKQSTVTFNDSQARVDDLLDATEDAGYPATLLEPASK